MAHYINTHTAIFFAVLLLTVPLPWLFAWIFAAIIHEACHCLAVWICGGRLEQISVSLQGIEIRSNIENPWQSALCSLAGPIGGAFLLLFADQFPRIAICALIQSVYNILPVYPLDGGHVIRNLLYAVVPSKIAEATCRCLELLTIIAMYGYVFWLSIFYRLGVLPLFVVIIFLLQTKKIKIPCKWRAHRVQ